MANICGNYLQVVIKDTLENQVGLGIGMARFASALWDYWCTSQTEPFSTPLAARCKMLGRFSVDHRHFGDIEEALHTTRHRSTHHEGCKQQKQQQQ